MILKISPYIMLIQGDSQNVCHYVYVTKNKFDIINCMHFIMSLIIP